MDGERRLGGFDTQRTREHAQHQAVRQETPHTAASLHVPGDCMPGGMHAGGVPAYLQTLCIQLSLCIAVEVRLETGRPAG